MALCWTTLGRRTREAVRLAGDERTIRDDLYSKDAMAWALHARENIDRTLRLGTPDARLLFHAGPREVEHSRGVGTPSSGRR